MQSPRFQAILRVTSGRKKRTPDIKSFSHELNSKGVRPFPVWKSRAFGHMEVNLYLYHINFYAYSILSNSLPDLIKLCRCCKIV